VGIVGHLSVLVFWIISIIKAYQGVKYKVPFIGDFVEKTANS
jgi:uncharacterized membrane protein